MPFLNPYSIPALSIRGRLAILFCFCVLLALITRLPLMPEHLYSFDSVNLALALEEFDPARNQPQPPGYPFFVATARVLYSLLGTPERTFAVLKILITGLSVAFLYLLGKQMISAGVGFAAAALLFVNPPFWYSGLASSLRLHLALISIVVAYCCWRAARGERAYFYAASLALGLGSGFRPLLLIVLFPLWLWAAWHTREARSVVRGVQLLAVSTMIWIGALVIASGGFVQTVRFFADYFISQTYQTSVLSSDPGAGWRHMVGRAVVWTGAGVVPWLWALPAGWFQRHRLPDWKRFLSFVVVWFLPPFLFNVLVHIGDPAQALASIPAVCLLGGFCMVATEQAVARRWKHRLRMPGLAIGFALLGNLILFLVNFPLPQAGRPAGFRGWVSMADAFRVGIYESSYARVRWVEDRTRLAFDQIRSLKSGTNRPVRLIWARDGIPGWRRVSFYFPSEKVYALDEQGDPAVPAAMARLWSGNQVLASYSGAPPFRLPLPKRARLIWVVGPSVVATLKDSVPLQSAGPLYYTDLAPDAPGFQWGSFEFVPE